MTTRVTEGARRERHELPPARSLPPQFSLNNITALSREKGVRIDKVITKGKVL